MSKNHIEVLPPYISEFHKLRVFKIENNPIEWPPSWVLERHGAADDDDGSWIQNVKEWMINNAAQAPDSVPASLHNLTDPGRCVSCH